ncbi:winged helix DNA-binding protein [Nitrosopumilus sp.]|uniref:winged helix DNA-binding protein n=1 Tax=Nitrosopumilus sp. TaxID=2024843 RepID=UPI003B5B8A1E
MLVEIPDPKIILGVILAFILGVGGLYAYYKIRPMIKNEDSVSGNLESERLEYYERQLIDMKIRLDALEIQGIEQKIEDPNLELKQFLEKLAKKEEHSSVVPERIEKDEVLTEKVSEKQDDISTIPKIDVTNPTDYVLQLITNKDMTSRDIQITLKRSREHTSRLMKKLFEDGYVQRNTESKPYTYSITEKGKMKVGTVQPKLTTA